MVEGFWKTRDNGGKAAWLFIGVLSSVYWVSDVITDDELACVNYPRVLLPKLVCETSLHEFTLT